MSKNLVILSAILTAPVVAHGDSDQMCMCTGALTQCMMFTDFLECDSYQRDNEKCSWTCPPSNAPELGASQSGESPKLGAGNVGYSASWIPGTSAGSCFLGWCLPWLRCEREVFGGTVRSRCVQRDWEPRGSEGQQCRTGLFPCNSGLECFRQWGGVGYCHYRLYKGDDDSSEGGQAVGPKLGAGQPVGPHSGNSGGQPVGPHSGNSGGQPVGPQPGNGGGQPVGPQPGIPSGVVFNDGTLGSQCIANQWCYPGLMCDEEWIHGRLYTTCVRPPSRDGTLDRPCRQGRDGQRNTCDYGLRCVYQGWGNTQPVCEYPLVYTPYEPHRPHPLGSSADGLKRRLDFAL